MLGIISCHIYKLQIINIINCCCHILSGVSSYIEAAIVIFFQMQVMICTIKLLTGQKNTHALIIRERIKTDFLSWQKSLSHSLRIFRDNFSLLSPLQRVLAAWFKIFNQFAIRSELRPRHNTTTLAVQDVQNGRRIGWLQW